MYSVVVDLCRPTCHVQRFAAHCCIIFRYYLGMKIYAINTETQSTMTKIVVSTNVPCAEICSTLLYYISLLTGYGNLCNQYRDSINNDKDCRVDQCAMCRDLLLLLLVSNWLRLRAFLEVDICSSQHYYTTTMICITGTLQQHEYKHKYKY